MREVIASIPWAMLLPLAILLGLAPFQPQPHLVEKIIMLTQGTLNHPRDIFDLFFHISPLLLIAAKLLLQPQRKENDT
jgi:hypothetical protein